MRDRLIELLCGHYMNTTSDAEEVADYLLENGVIVPPCKVGDTVYRIDDKQVYDWWQVEHIEIYADEIVFVDDSDNEFTEDDIGKTVFLTKEEAEKVLRGE